MMRWRKQQRLRLSCQIKSWSSPTYIILTPKWTNFSSALTSRKNLSFFLNSSNRVGITRKSYRGIVYFLMI
ncbi:hypothetical protein JOB18_010250 [Solea senegalensis]|uniref:Uncharacterized protein n=1 Tax=Solea senegalensis TaxID=28829 RepID=A0AAV6SIF4_SOLSE|nr:hypothetical protein JOB18_010250 [Solea senegalensis]